MNNHKTRLKSFIGGLVIGVVAGAVIGGLAIANVMAIAFINYNLIK